jgi:sec-independent protein translocase protein TatB
MGIPPPIETANISMGDTLLLMVIALVVLGPRRLPQIGRQIGKLMYEFRKASNDFKFQMEEELRQSEEADRRKKEEEERKRVLAAAPPQAQIAPPAESPITPTVESPIMPPVPAEPDPQITPAPPEPPPAIPADVPEAEATAVIESGAPAAVPSEPGDLKNVTPDQQPATGPVAPRILPPPTGETVPADRPGAQPRQRELFTADGSKNLENAGQDAAEPEAERSEPATHHAERHG